MLTSEARGRLLASVIELYEKSGEVIADPPRQSFGPVPIRGMGPSLTAGQEAVLAEVMGTLTRIVAVVATRTAAPTPPTNVVIAALSGAEIVMRGEILIGRDDWLPRLLPSFTFLATLPFLDRERALQLAARTERLAKRFR